MMIDVQLYRGGSRVYESTGLNDLVVTTGGISRLIEIEVTSGKNAIGSYRADGIIVAGCHIGDCHYLKGNYMTIKRVAILKELLKFTGFQEERLHLEWISAAEGVRFAELVSTFTQKIRELGPSHLKTSY